MTALKARTVAFALLLAGLVTVTGAVTAHAEADRQAETYQRALTTFAGGNHEAAFAGFMTAAEAGHVKAQTYVAWSYLRGAGVEKNPQAAVHWYRRAAENGSPEAKYQLGRIFSTRSGVPQDPEESRKWYRAALEGFEEKAKAGDIKAQMKLAHMYRVGLGGEAEPEAAVRWYRQAAEQGNAAAQYNLAMIYSVPSGVPLDYPEAAKWFHKAADQGLAAAQSTLAVMYATGQGVPRDDRQALQWNLRAAAQGDSLAQVGLAMSYAAGKGVPQDFIEAYMWIEIAIRDTTAGYESQRRMWEGARDRLAAEMRLGEIAMAEVRAASWRPALENRDLEVVNVPGGGTAVRETK